jgi:hypothetical protein
MGERILIEADFSDDELAAYQRIVDRLSRRGGDLPAWGVYATGFFIALIGAFSAFGAGVTPARGVDVVAVLIFAGFFVGLWSPSIWYRRRRRKVMRERARQAAILVTANGLFVRRAGARGFYSRRVIAKVTMESGLLLVWIRDARPLAIPSRLLAPAHKARLAALATTSA